MRLETILSHFRLDGDTVIRVSTGKPIRASRPNRQGYITVSVGGPKGTAKREKVHLHRLKFALAHGYLPPDVDHRNRDRSDNSVANLRAATRQQNLWNKGQDSSRGLPRGVSRIRNGRYRSAATMNYRRVHLGYFDTAEEASVAYEKYCRETRGEFHVGAH